jgi:DNA polymerase I
VLEQLSRHYRHVIAADFEFEFGGCDGNRPRPVCMVAHDLLSGQRWRIWRGDFGTAPPFPIGPDTLFVAYMASAELGCFRALGWLAPARILDLYVEFRNLTNGRYMAHGKGLLGALIAFGIDGIDAHEKEAMRDLILAGGPWTAAERADILDYCASDVVGLEKLLPAMLPHIDLPRALLRGRYMAASAAMEFNGVPIDTELLNRLREHWGDIQGELIGAIDADYHVFDGRSFRRDWFEAFLVHESIPWPRLKSGVLDLTSSTFREMAKAYPIIAPLYELRHALSALRLNALTVGDDGRNRTVLWAFASKTGRNQPSNTKYIFGPSVWIRGLIKPEPGYAIAYIDYGNQEFGIAAALSGDAKMMEAYRSGDPYLAFGRQCHYVPPDATEETHLRERGLLKICVLGVQFGMEAKSLASRLGEGEIVARGLLWRHRDTYRKFWRFSDAAADTGLLGMPLETVFGWRLSPGDDPNPRSLRNFPMQANGAEMLRLACCLGIERGIEIVAPVHDAVMIHAPLDRIDQHIATMREAMAEASRIVLGGFELRTDCKAEGKFPSVIRYPDRYQDKRGAVMWRTVMQLLDRIDHVASSGVA